ncbi:MAG: ATP-dependent RNA helicase HrpA [Puniceicoccaceae bacterium]|nr:MAG: ATP-dependent RNA helicase HrpA [Puniceicoccaceae bacterium]
MSVAIRAQRLIPTYSDDLPIHQRREEIIRTIRENQVVVIAGETGSGKTTQIPKFLLECELGQKGLIGCTQPRRVAALSVAQRIAEELGVTYGEEVGAKIRFTDQTRADTCIKVMTDGILLNEIQEDPRLRAYEAIIIDEAHERSLNIDFILGCLRQLIQQRDDLKIIITSATIDTGRFAAAFDDAPVIEVSGRMFPVETHYRPFEESDSEGDYIQQSAELVEEILEQNQRGDILVFLPAERDIHELNRQLEDGPARQCDRLPLFGRLANADQQRIFRPGGGRRRIILSTNIAETSLTVPGIRYVVDTGLARISRYSPHSRTLRLPIEPVAQSSAEQRKGRCGRVSNGVCYRLYSEADFLARPRYTTPEIHRSNLASVILRMMAFRLGDIRSFPFIDPPAENAIVGGYRLLAELGAVEPDPKSTLADDYRLTRLGRRLAQLPLDPTVGRMLLQAEEEQVLPEVLVIAAGLSIQDPRERPAEIAKEADEMHKRFTHPESDFLTLLNIWNAYHEKLDSLSQSKLRKFCKTHFLAYQRMREWRDIHHQLERVLASLKSKVKKNASLSTSHSPLCREAASYAAVHRSIITGLLSNIAHKEAGHDYRGPRNRKALLFPGSGLFDHDAAKKQRKASYASKAKPKPAKTKAPEWIVCGEWMETSRLFARTAAKIEVAWVEDLAADLIQVRHSEPFWSTKAAAALCQERRLLFGLELARNQVSYSRINPAEATEIFIRNGLIEGGIRERPPFLQHNAEALLSAESEVARRRMGSTFLVEDNLFDFYRRRLDGVGSYAELRAYAKKHHGGSLDFLQASESDLLPADAGEVPAEDFPRVLLLGGSEIPLQYRNERGSEDDGVTLCLPLAQVDALQQGTLDWAVPGHVDEKVECLLRGLPKPIRVQLHPLKERAREIRQALRPSERALSEQLAAHLRSAYGIETYRDQWAQAELPHHLKPRIQVENTRSELLAHSRDLEDLRQQLRQKSQQAATGRGLHAIPAWQEAAARYEREQLTGWSFPDLPECIDLSGTSGLPLKAYPALVTQDQAVHLRLLPDREQALRATTQAWPDLAEQVMGREIAWIQRDLKALKTLGVELLQLGGYAAIKDPAWAHLRRHLFHTEKLLPLQAQRFSQTLDQAKARARGLVLQLVDQLRELLAARQAVLRLLEEKRTKQAIIYPGMRAHLEHIAPPDLLTSYEFSDLPHLTRYLKAMLLRAQRARESIQRDIEKSQRIAPHEAKLKELEQLAAKTSPGSRSQSIKPYKMLLEEFKVSIYAQELGTAQKASEKRLDALATSMTIDLTQFAE